MGSPCLWDLHLYGLYGLRGLSWSLLCGYLQGDYTIGPRGTPTMLNSIMCVDSMAEGARVGFKRTVQGLVRVRGEGLVVQVSTYRARTCPSTFTRWSVVTLWVPSPAPPPPPHLPLPTPPQKHWVLYWDLAGTRCRSTTLAASPRSMGSRPVLTACAEQRSVGTRRTWGPGVHWWLPGASGFISGIQMVTDKTEGWCKHAC